MWPYHPGQPQQASATAPVTSAPKARAAAAEGSEPLATDSDAIVALDSAHRITIWSPAARRLFGYSQREAVGHRMEEFIRSRDPSTQRRIHESVLPPHKAHFEVVLQDRSGQDLTAEVSVAPLGERRLAGAVVSIRDVTTARQFSRRIRDAAVRESCLARELEQTRRHESVGQLSSAVAHDFNHFLGVIQNLAALIAAESPKGSTVRGDANEISRTAKRAATLASQLLSFSRREIVEQQVLEPGRVVADLQQFLGHALGTAVTLTVEAVPAPWLVRMDRGQLEQIVVNLAVNGRDAMPAGGDLTISTRNTTISDAASSRTGLVRGRYVTLTVSDTGTGMAPEVLARALEPFFTTKSEDEGTGLGLATVQRIATQAGGRVTIVSEPERGTAVHVHLPTVLTSRDT